MFKIVIVKSSKSRQNRASREATHRASSELCFVPVFPTAKQIETARALRERSGRKMQGETISRTL